MSRPHNPFNLLLIISLVLTSSSSHTISPDNSEKSALLEFKSSVSDPTGLLTSWNFTSSDHCLWIGVTCGSNSRVIALNITGGGNSGNFTCSMYNQFPLYGFGIRKNCVDGNGKLVGKLSSFISKLSYLRILSLPFNDLSGEIPVEIWGMEQLEVIDLEGNLIHGKLQSHFTGLASLRVLNLGFNHLSGEIPDWLTEIKTLQILNLAGNRFNGSFPRYLDEFGDLRGLYLSFNQLSGDIPNEIGYNCGSLEHLELAGNLLVGRIPNSLGNCTKLQSVLLYANLLQEEIPIELGNLEALRILDLSRNSLSGAIPHQLGRCLNLSVLVFSNLMNPIPVYYNSVDALRQLGSEDESNYFEGLIPTEITTLPNLQLLWAPRTVLEGPVPNNWGACASLEMVNLAQNLFVGEISKGLDVCEKLHFLDLSSNRLTGGISDKLGVSCMTVFDVSGNYLSGPIPSYRHTTCEPFSPSTAYLRYFLSKDLRTASLISLANLTPDQPVGNDFANLAGQPVSTSRHGRALNLIETAPLTCVFAVFTVIPALVVLFLCTNWRPKSVPQARGSVRKEVILFTNIGVPLTFENVVRSTGSFNASNCIGSGGFGATFKAEISPGFFVAVKRLSVGRFQGVQQFDAEIKTLGLLRHPNLVTLIGYYTGESERFLIYNYLPGGNLERFIQERPVRPAGWRILHKIALGVARALAYLHDQCVPRVIHRDVKPNNILLDNDFNAYLSDFGLARILGTLQTHATTGVAGTFGYLAPEYALTSRVSNKADVFSYGVVLLELISDKKLLDPSFSLYGNGFNIVGWACMLLREGRAKDFFAEGLWDMGLQDDLVEALQLAVVCTEDSPSTRPTMQQVVRRLKQLKPPPF